MIDLLLVFIAVAALFAGNFDAAAATLRRRNDLAYFFLLGLSAAVCLGLAYVYSAHFPFPAFVYVNF